MSNLNSMQVTAQKGKLDRNGINRIVQIFVTIAVIALVLFLSAGRLDWIAAWVFIGLYILAILTAGVWIMRHNPDLVNERGRVAENTKWWDKIIGIIYTVAMLAMFVVAGLDAGRFGRSTMPFAVQALGVVGFIGSMVIIYWVMLSNPFLSGVVRIQDDRGQKTITTGPYRLVRHPMYVGMMIFFVAIPLILGSAWALIPSLVMVAVFVVRTALEDRTLQNELPGYAEYAQRVRYRLVPGVW